MIATSTAIRMCYVPARPTACSTQRKLGVAVKKIKLDYMRDWLEKQDGYTIHRPIRKRFAPKRFAVIDVKVLWECDLFDVRALGQFNDNYKFILSLIDVFLHLVPLKSKTGKAVASRLCANRQGQRILE